jgi:hypothetical protein
VELLLNLAWILLAVPAYWLWRGGARARQRCTVTPLQCSLILGCGLVLLFPVISASDDLHAMRAEMEESASSKWTARQAGSDRNSAWINRLQSPPAMAAAATQPALREVGLLQVSVVSLSPLARHCALRAGRAPPYSFLG